MIVILIGIIALIIIILLLAKIVNKKKEATAVIVIGALLIWLGLLSALATIIFGIIQPTKMGEWEVKEAIKPTLLNDEENAFGGYTYQYLIPERWNTKRNVINYEVEYLFQNVPILVECERKAEPTIWTLGLGYKETKYVFYSPDDTIN